MLRLRELRAARKINQKTLADYIGVTQATLSGWETGKYDIDNKSLSKCADYFGVTTDYILGRTDGKEQGSNIHITDEHNQTITLDDDALEMIDSLRSRPEMKMLFSVSKKATSEDIIKAVKIIEALRGESEN